MAVMRRAFPLTGSLGLWFTGGPCLHSIEPKIFFIPFLLPPFFCLGILDEKGRNCNSVMNASKRRDQLGQEAGSIGRAG